MREEYLQGVYRC